MPFNVSAHNGTYSAAHNDADLNTIGVSWLVTPPISIDSGVYLHFWDAYYYTSYYRYHGVWVSTGSCNPNDGAFVELSGIGHTGDEGEWHERHLSLGSYAGTTICIAFRYDGDADDEWYIDDVLVDHEPAPWKLNESFESLQFPPRGWLKYETGDSSDPGWLQTKGVPFHVSAYDGKYSAFHNNDDLNSPADAWLVSNYVSVDSNTYLHFWEAYYWSDHYDYHGVWVSDGSSNPSDGDFSELAEIPHTGNENEWHEYHLSLSAYDGKTVCIAFRYQGDYEDEWYVDKVVVDQNPLPVELMSYAVE